MLLFIKKETDTYTNRLIQKSFTNIHIGHYFLNKGKATYIV